MLGGGGTANGNRGGETVPDMASGGAILLSAEAARYSLGVGRSSKNHRAQGGGSGDKRDQPIYSGSITGSGLPPTKRRSIEAHVAPLCESTMAKRPLLVPGYCLEDGSCGRRATAA